MQKFVISLLLIVAVAWASPADAVFADENSIVTKNFKLIGRDLRSMDRISDADEMAAKLERFLELASENREAVPSFMESGTEQHADYLEGIDAFIGDIEAALVLAKAGDLDGAKEITGEFGDMRKKYHKHFNIERR